MQVESTRLYRVRAVADSLDVSVATIYRAVETGALRAVRLGTGKGAVRIPGQAVEEYIAACERAAAKSNRSTSLVLRGLACAICGRDFRNLNVNRYPVGWSRMGSQVFACETHQESSALTTAGGVA